jgi:hypothetical protein
MVDMLVFIMLIVIALITVAPEQFGVYLARIRRGYDSLMDGE